MKISLQRFWVATILVVIGYAALADFVVALRQRQPGHGDFRLIEALFCLPIIGAGLFTPMRRTILGAFLGALLNFACVALLTLWNFSTN